MKKGLIFVQLGKSGLTEGFIEGLQKNFKSRELIKISVLRSFSRDRDKILELAENIRKALGENYTYRMLGFTIILRKWRKPQKQN